MISNLLLVPTASVLTRRATNKEADMPGSMQSHNLSFNWLLAGLPKEEYERFLPSLETVSLRFGQVLYHPQEPIHYLYFPDNGCVVSLTTSLEDGSTVEVGAVGSEGLVGLSIFWGVQTTPYGAVVQIPGSAMRLNADVLKRMLNELRTLHGILLRYTHAMVVQIAQTSACNCKHALEERLARWLLVCHDRARSDDFPLTHEFIAEMLGVRRAGVTEAALSFQNSKLIRYKRGHITIMDRRGLEKAACECYRVVREELQNYLTAIVPQLHQQAALSIESFETLSRQHQI
jgi:CRP-like cAMP-binding protein